MPRVTSTRLLGIIVDENSNWREQADWVGTKVNKSIGIIRRVSHLVSRNCLLTLYYSLIYPYLSYCNIVWASTFLTALHKILVLQRRFVRIATRSESYAASTPLFKKTASPHHLWHQYFSNLCFIYEIYSGDGNILEHFMCYFKANSQVHSYTTRQSADLHPPQFLTSQGQFSIRYRGSKVWNNISHLAKNCATRKRFRRCLKDHLTAVP